MKKFATFLKSVLIIRIFLIPIFAMDKECNDSSYKISIEDEWEMIENSNISDNSTNNNTEDFELKAQAFGNTVISILGGLGTTVCNIGLNLIENKIQNNINQFDHGVRNGSELVGNLYGQGIALKDIYESEKDLLNKK